MKDLAGDPAELDYVDRLIDQVVADPTRGDDVKTILKHKMKEPDALAIVRKPLSPARSEEEADDLWDNVPV